MTECDLIAAARRGNKAVPRQSGSEAWKSKQHLARFPAGPAKCQPSECDSDPDPQCQAPPTCSCFGGLFLSCMYVHAGQCCRGGLLYVFGLMIYCGTLD